MIGLGQVAIYSNACSKFLTALGLDYKIAVVYLEPPCPQACWVNAVRFLAAN
jgi:hypothetical protein